MMGRVSEGAGEVTREWDPPCMMGLVSEGAGEVTREWEPAQRPENIKQVFYLSPLEK